MTDTALKGLEIPPEKELTAAEIATFKFGPAAGEKIESCMTLETWLERARGEFQIKQMCLMVLNSDDEELERMVEDPESTGLWLSLAEDAVAWKGVYESGITMYGSVGARLLTVLSRVIEEDCDGTA